MPPSEPPEAYYLVMRPGLRPRVIRQIFAPIPAARSRCLSSFIAISRQGLPAQLRYEPSHVLGAISLIFLFVGFFIESYVRIGSTLVLLGWGTAALALVALLGQDKLVYGFGRPRLLRMLDESRRTVGLDEALLPESLEFLETTAQQWERIEHALQAKVWDQFEDRKFRVHLAAHQAMEDVVVIECGTTDEAGLTDLEADQVLADTAANLRILADAVDAASAAIMTTPRESTGLTSVLPNGAHDEMVELEKAISRLSWRRTDTVKDDEDSSVSSDEN